MIIIFTEYFISLTSIRHVYIIFNILASLSEFLTLYSVST